MKILVGSHNPVKVDTVKRGFLKFFDEVDVEGISISSGVAEQPMSEEETLRGAHSRAVALREQNNAKNLDADFFVGVEGGVRKIGEVYYEFGCICIIDANGREAFGNSSDCQLPQSVVKRLLDGEELGVVMDEIVGEKNTKQKDGAIGYFTRGVMSRSDFYVDGVVMALVPFLNKKLYFDEKKN